MSRRKIYFEDEVDISILKDKVIAIIGYGNQGRAQAKGLKEVNNLNVIVGNIKDESWDKAIADGYEVYPIDEATKRADIIFLLVPDEVAPEVYYNNIEPVLKSKEFAVLNFASGYNITYGFIKPIKQIDVVMVAPRMTGFGIISRLNEGKGYPTLMAVAQDYSGKAKDYALAIAKGIGSLLPGGLAVESSFEEETLVDLFSEHSWAGALLFTMKACYEALVEAGVAPEVALLELYASGEMIEAAKAITEIGLFKQLKIHSKTSQYGQLTRGPKYINDEFKNMLRKVIKEIKDGTFATEWTLEMKAGMPKFKRLIELTKEYDISKAEDELYRILKRKA